MDKRIAVVTGGAKGIGYGIVKKLIKEGVKVYVIDVDEDTCKKIKVEHRDMLDFYVADLTNDEEVKKVFYLIKEKEGHIDILICNAGITIRKWAVDLTMDDYDRLMNIDLRAYYLCSKLAAEIMMNQDTKGNIVCISSANSATYHSKRSLYNTAKAAINGMVGTLGVEWARFGVRINAVAPGYVLTELLESGIKDGIIDEKNIMSVVPIKRYISIEEVANVVYFLADSVSSGITGQTVFVDGGWSKNALPED